MTSLRRVAPPKPTAIGPGGLPTYTRAQLQQVKPGADYGKYIGYITKRRMGLPGPAYPGRGGIGMALPTIESMIRQVQIESPAQLQARQQKMVADQVKAQQGLVYDEATRARAQALRTMQAQSAAGQAAAALNNDLFGMVGGEYNRGAQELAGLATGGVADVTDTTAQNTQALNQSLASVGMPGIDSRMAGPQQAAVARYQAGLGAQNLAAQGEAANFGLAGQINSQNLRATQEAVAGQNVANTDIEAKQADAIREIARQRPDVAAKILAQLQDANRQQIALGSTLLQQRRAALQAGFQQSMTKKTFAQNREAGGGVEQAGAGPDRRSPGRVPGQADGCCEQDGDAELVALEGDGDAGRRERQDDPGRCGQPDRAAGVQVRPEERADREDLQAWRCAGLPVGRRRA